MCLGTQVEIKNMSTEVNSSLLFDFAWYEIFRFFYLSDILAQNVLGNSFSEHVFRQKNFAIYFALFTLHFANTSSLMTFSIFLFLRTQSANIQEFCKRQS